MRIVLPLAGLLFLAACTASIGKSPQADDEDDAKSATCEPKTTAACTCGSLTGKKSCGANGTYGSCFCPGASGAGDEPDAGSSTTTTTTGADASTAAQFGPQCLQLASCCAQIRAMGQEQSANDCAARATEANEQTCANLSAVLMSNQLGMVFCVP